MLSLAVELLRLPEESCATIHLGIPVRIVVAPHRQANAKASEGTTFKFSMIYMKETTCLQIT